MNDTKLSRNDLCHCGSGRKYKKCCLQQDDARESRYSSPPHESKNSRLTTNIEDTFDDHDYVICLAANPPKPNVFSVGIGMPSAPPNFNRRKELDYTKPITRVDVSYAFDELQGRAEVSYSFPVGRLVRLKENDFVIQIERLKPGMRFKIESGEIATVTKVGKPSCGSLRLRPARVRFAVGAWSAQ